MQVVHSLQSAAASGVTHLALGFFDGLHVGHWSVIKPANGPVHDVLTFWPHPRTILRPHEQTHLITGLEHKLHLLEINRVSRVIVHPFDTTTATTEAIPFLEALRDSLPGLRSLSCGPNFHFGKNRVGNPELLAQWCSQNQLGFHTATFQLDPTGVVSSSRIREALHQGDLPLAGQLLGRPYAIRGRVVRGDGLGRQLGFPTANLETDDHWQLPTGVYSSTISIDKVCENRRAVLNAGHRPTLNHPDPVFRIEAHIPGFEGDLYGQTVELTPQTFLRPEQRFPDTESLRAQIRQDIETAQAPAR